MAWRSTGACLAGAQVDTLHKCGIIDVPDIPARAFDDDKGACLTPPPAHSTTINVHALPPSCPLLGMMQYYYQPLYRAAVTCCQVIKLATNPSCTHRSVLTHVFLLRDGGCFPLHDTGVCSSTSTLHCDKVYTGKAHRNFLKHFRPGHNPVVRALI